MVNDTTHVKSFIATCIIYFVVIMGLMMLRIAGGLGWFELLGGEKEQDD